MIIDCVSDLHGNYPELEGGDLLIVAGDWTLTDSEENLRCFEGWLLSEGASKYKETIVIAGNHDNFAYELKRLALTPYLHTLPQVKYLCDSGTEFEGLKIWGSPWTLRFEGMNPNCMAFTVETEEDLAKKWALIPDDTDILVTHSPCWGMNDGPHPEVRYGSTSLLRRVVDIGVTKLKLHVCGHIHEGYGVFDIRKWQKRVGESPTTVFVNASQVNEYYNPVRVTL